MKHKLITTLCLLTLPVLGEPAASIEQPPAAASADEPAPSGAVLFWSQDERRVAFQRAHETLAARRIEAGRHVYPLVNATRDLSSISYKVDGQDFRLDDFMAMQATIGLIVVQDDRILLEHYAPGNTASSLWISFSVAKSVTSLLIGAAIKDGYIGSVDDLVVDYVPRFRGTGYADVTIRDVLNMASGVLWDENYDDPESDVAKAGGMNGLPLLDYLGHLPSVDEPGRKFNYNTGETNLAGEILRAAIGNNAATYLTHKIWQPFGMEYDAWWNLGSAGGGELGGCCINASLRDYARIGLFAMNEGSLADGSSILPDGWMAESTRPSRGNEGYGYLWWLMPDESYSALGIFGQTIYIDPAARLVIAIHGNGASAVDSPFDAHRDAAIQAIRKALKN